MMDEQDVIEAEVEQLEDETSVDEEVAADDTSAQEVEGEATAAEPEEAGELSITLGDEPEQQEEEHAAPDWVKDLRKTNRELVRKQRELETENTRLKGSAPQAVRALGPKPTLAGCDYDEAKYEADLETWSRQKTEVETQEAQKRREAETAEQTWQTRLSAVNKFGREMKVTDHDDALGTFEDTFSVVQRGIILDAPSDPKLSAQLRYALGRNPKVAKELAGESHPVRFTFKLAELANKMKVTPKKTAPAPERVVRAGGGGSASAAQNSQLKKLQDEAERTGDRSKVAAFIRKSKQPA